MTNNQLRFKELQEMRRHNAESEKLQEFQNISGRLSAMASGTQAAASMQQAQVASLKQVEEARHNIASERIQRSRNTIDALTGVARVATSLVATMYGG